MKDKVRSPKGTVELWCYDKEGKLLWHKIKHNLVVNNGKTCMAHSLGGDTAHHIITQIQAGTNSAATSLSDTAIMGGAAAISIGAVTYPSATSVKFAFLFGTGDANGITIREFGLLTDTNILYSRVTWAAIAKTSAISIIGTWEIDF